jgi:hypothetical protein
MSQGLTIALLTQTGALFVVCLTVWSQGRNLRKTLTEQGRNLERQLASQRQVVELQLKQAAQESRAAWLRERQERIAAAALDTATEAVQAFGAAMGDLSQAVIAAREPSKVVEYVAASKTHRDDLRRAHARLAMVAPGPSDALVPIRAHLEHFHRMVGEQMANFTGGAAAPEWVKEYRDYREAEQHFQKEMVDFMYGPEPQMPSSGDLKQLRLSISDGEG